MPSVTEGPHKGEFLIAPADDMGTRSFDYITVDASQTLVAGQIIGQVGRGALSVAAAKRAGGSAANGAVSGATVAAGSKLGVYSAVFVEPVANLGNFEFFDPDGNLLGTGVVGTAFTLGGITATIADGATDWASGDIVDYTVTAATASDDKEWKAVDLSATDGSQIPAGIIYDNITTGAGQVVKATAVTRDCEVNGNLLTYPAGSNGTQQATIRAQLSALGIIVR